MRTTKFVVFTHVFCFFACCFVFFLSFLRFSLSSFLLFRILYGFFRPIFQNRLRRALIAGVEENVSRLALLVDEQLVTLANKAMEVTHMPALSPGKQEQPVQQTNPQTTAYNWTSSGDTRRNY